MRARSVRFPAPGEIEIVAAEVAAPGRGELRCTAEVSLVSVGTELTCLLG